MKISITAIVVLGVILGVIVIMIAPTAVAIFIVTSYLRIDVPTMGSSSDAMTSSSKTPAFSEKEDPRGKYLLTSMAYTECLNLMIPKTRGYTLAHTIVNNLATGAYTFEQLERIYNTFSCDINIGPLPPPKE